MTSQRRLLAGEMAAMSVDVDRCMLISFLALLLFTGIHSASLRSSRRSSPDLAHELSKLGYGAAQFQRATLSPAELNVQACSGEAVITRRRGFISYPDTGEYAENIECHWIVFAAKGMVINVGFMYMDVECNDVVQVFNYAYGTPGLQLVQMCGTDGILPEANHTWHSDSNAVFIRFRSDKRGSGTGFGLRFAAVDGYCGTPRFPPSGYDVVNEVKIVPSKPNVPIIKPDMGHNFFSHPMLIPRIIGGSEAIPHSWPWLVAVRAWVSTPLELRRYCGAALVHSRWAITAAHCVFFLETTRDLAVIIEQHDFRDMTQDKIITVKRVIAYPGFDRATFRGDLALMELDQELPFSAKSSPICLPTVDADVGTMCAIAGWGITNTTSETLGVDLLHQGAVPIIKDSQCQDDEWLGSFIYPENQFCAGYEQGGIDSCRGDSGGPLVCLMGDKWTLMGITSFGWSCAEPKKPGVYTRVTKYTDWIHKTINGG